MDSNYSLKINLFLDKRIITIEELFDISNITNELYFEVSEHSEDFTFKELAKNFDIRALILKSDGLTFGHCVCFYNKMDHYLIFGYFGNYGQNGLFTKKLINHIQTVAKKLKAHFIIGPINIPANKYGFGFNLETHDAYIDLFLETGFVQIYKNEKNMVFIKNLLPKKQFNISTLRKIINFKL